MEQANFTCIEMQADGDFYTAEIPALATPGTMQYYIRAADIYGNENITGVYDIDVSRQDEVIVEDITHTKFVMSSTAIQRHKNIH